MRLLAVVTPVGQWSAAREHDSDDAVMSAIERRAEADAANSAGTTASKVHCLVPIARPSATAACIDRPRAAQTTASTASAPPSTSSGWPERTAFSVIG